MKISPGAYIFKKPFFEGQIFGGAYIRRGLYTEGNLRFKIGQAYTGGEILRLKIDWASLWLEGNFISNLQKLALRT